MFFRPFLPFLPYWASAKCSKCKVEQDWDERPVALSDEETNEFCVLRCSRADCREQIVKCRHCPYNFPLNDSDAMGKEKQSKDGRAKKKMKQHMMNRHGHLGDYVPTLPEHGQSDNLLAQASSMLCNATSSFCEGSGCGGSSFHEEDEVDKVPGLLDRSPHLDEEDSDEEDQNDYSTLQQDLADLHSPSREPSITGEQRNITR